MAGAALSGDACLPLNPRAQMMSSHSRGFGWFFHGNQALGANAGGRLGAILNFYSVGHV